MDRFSIWQQNVNKSPSCQHDIISNKRLVTKGISLIALQEPALSGSGLTIASRDWITIYPSSHADNPLKARSITLIRANINTESWNQLEFPSSDVTVTQITGHWGKITILNIYNKGESDETINLLTDYHRRNKDALEHAPTGEAHILWIGDFNRHHPLWDNPEDTRLFTNEATEAAEKLIEAVADAGLELTLPSGTPTHKHNVTKCWSRLDQVFLSEHSSETLISCDTLTGERGINTDHLPILTELRLEVGTTVAEPLLNFRNANWEEFKAELQKQLSNTPKPARILDQSQLNARCEELTNALQETIRAEITTVEITTKSKRWWTKELSQLRARANKLGRTAYKLRDDREHRIHKEYKEAKSKYQNTLKDTKRLHWREWLEKAEDPDLWAAHRMTAAPPTDGGKAKIPKLKHRVDGGEVIASTNKEKSVALAKCFFPIKPQETEANAGMKFPKACKGVGSITREQIGEQLRKTKPFKAPGPDGIPNIVLSRCADIITDRLFYIYEAMLERGLLYNPWKVSTTVVLRKPGKPRYDVPKAYRPIALLNTMWKVLTAIVANHITHLTEKYQLLPLNHFGGRPGRTTTDALHILAHTIKKAWRAGSIAAVLFLDIEGAFPNAVPSRLLHNLRKCRIPGKYVNFVEKMLTGRRTSLKYDGYTSEPLEIDNGIGQGDPLSMVLYQYYNADLLDIPSDNNESALAYVDDTILIATADNFTEAHDKLADMMCREGGVSDWSTTHNSPLEYSKLALIDFAHRSSSKTRTPLQLPQRQILPTSSTKYLGVVIDQSLGWKAQQAYAVEKGTKWAMQIRRITRPTWGITPKYARQLYLGVALPRILYAADVWCVADRGERTRTSKIGPVKALDQVTTIQRAGALAITGGLRSSATDSLNAHAHLLPAALMVRKWCHRALTRMAALPKDHPLYKHINHRRTGKIKKHKGPLHHLLRWFKPNVSAIEKIPATARSPTKTGKIPLIISIAESREESIKETESAPEEIQIYTDGSALEGKVGAAAVLFIKGRHTQTLHYHLGSDAEHTVHEAELVGLLLGLHMLTTGKRRKTAAMIGVDNQAAIKALASDLRSPGHHLAREALQLATNINKAKIKSKNNKATLIIRWTAAHEGLEGNELADREAKEAASGRTSDTKQIPRYLRKPIPANPSAVKKAHNEELKNEWKETWRSSERGKAVARIDESTPSSKFLKSISNPKLSRTSASRIAQLRLAHFPLNTYLKRIRKVDSTRCPACGEDEESITHFLLKCSGYAHERWTLTELARKKRKALTSQLILGDPQFILPLAAYMHATGRFTQQGERNTTQNGNTAQ